MAKCTCGVGDACNICGGNNEITQLVRDIDMARRITASDPYNIWCRQATIILNASIREHASSSSGPFDLCID